MTKFNIAIDDSGASTVTMVSQGQITTIDDSHPFFGRIVDALVEGGDPTDWLDFSASVTDLDGFNDEGDGISWGDGEPVGEPLTVTYTRYVVEGRDTSNLPRFMERLAKNPSAHARKTLWEWLGVQGLNIDTEGYIIGYKGVQRLDEDGYAFESSSSGRATVDGDEKIGQIPQNVGSVVEMPRTEVMDDPNSNCAEGLHVGTYDYATGFGPVTLEVRVDPADVVSVPTGCAGWKIRCCKYKVLAVHNPDAGDDLTAYEPEATQGPDHVSETLAPLVPVHFLDRLRSRLGRK